MPRTFTFASAVLGPVLTCAVALNAFSSGDNTVPTVSFTPSLHGPAKKDPAADARACPDLRAPVTPAVERAGYRLAPAAQDVDRGLGRRYPSVYTGVISCAPTGTLIVFRIPGSTSFDRAVRAVGQRRHVKVALADARYSHRTLESAENVVRHRVGALKRAGATWRGMDIQPEGYVEVFVAGHPVRAREVLHDLGDRVKVKVQRQADRPT